MIDTNLQETGELPKGSLTISIATGSAGVFTVAELFKQLKVVTSEVEAGHVTGALKDADGCLIGQWWMK